MSDFGDGREERMDAFLLECRLMANPAVRRRKHEYETAVAKAREYAASIGADAVIDALISRTPAYIRTLLETEDARMGKGSLSERYARTFYNDFRDHRHD